MERFEYIAVDKGGKKSQGEIEAISQQQATGILRTKGLFIISLRKIEMLPGWLLWTQKLRRVKFSDVVHFTRQLATMMVRRSSV